MFWSITSRAAARPETYAQSDLLWALGSMAALHRRPFPAELLARDFPDDGSPATLVRAARKLGLHATALPPEQTVAAAKSRPVLVALRGYSHDALHQRLGLLTTQGERASLLAAGHDRPDTLSLSQLAGQLTGSAWAVSPAAAPLRPAFSMEGQR